QHEQQRPPQPVPAADHLVRRRLREAQRRAAPALSGSHTAGERHAHDSRSHRDRAGEVRRQHGRAFRSMSMHRGLVVAVFLALAAANAAGADLSLVEAAKAGDRERALALIEEKTDVNAAATDGTTALHYAVYHDDVELVSRLLAAGAKANVSNEYGSTP